jgi:SAM-dependent methyltransferase
MLFDHLCTKEKKVLDVGCGNGVFTRKMAGICETILAIDINPKRIANLDAFCREHEIRNVVVREMNACHLPFADQEFDLAVFYRSVDHIPEYEMALKEAFRVLKKPGMIYLVTPDTERASPGISALDSLRKFEDGLFDLLGIGEGMCETRSIAIPRIKEVLAGLGFSHFQEKILESSPEQEKEHFERVREKTEELLGMIQETSLEAFQEQNAGYDRMLKNIRENGIGLRPMIEIVGET